VLGDACKGPLFAADRLPFTLALHDSVSGGCSPRRWTCSNSEQFNRDSDCSRIPIISIGLVCVTSRGLTSTHSRHRGACSISHFQIAADM
jgi:hypothetical protein